MRNAATPATPTDASEHTVILVNDELIFNAARLISTLFDFGTHENIEQMIPELTQLNSLFNVLLSLCICKLNDFSDNSESTAKYFTLSVTENDGELKVQIRKADIGENDSYRNESEDRTGQALINALYALLQVVD